MKIAPLTRDEVQRIGGQFGMSLSREDAEIYASLAEGILADYERVLYLSERNNTETPAPRTWSIPEQGANPLNGWRIRTRIEGAKSGPLHGRTVAIKDNICVAGVPMSMGAGFLRNYVPKIDATIVERVLEAGATITGKANCEYLCFSGGSHTNFFGAVHNPHRPGYSAGGSSSGSAALVSAGAVDMAIGGDQGGSIRIPSSWCGVCGLKPTYGLVPYTGIMSGELTIDHAGPITRTVSDNAALLEAIAGDDGIDPRQSRSRPTSYLDSLEQELEGTRIGVLREGFGHDNSEPDVSAKVQAAADRLARLGACVVDISVEEHRDGAAIATGIALEGMVQLVLHGLGFGTSNAGRSVPEFSEAMAKWRERIEELAAPMKLALLVVSHLSRHSDLGIYGRARNLAHELCAAYERALSKVDLLLLPTLPHKATPLPPEGAPPDVVVTRGFEMLQNVPQFNVTGHPALSIPCGLSDGLPVGMMLVGRHLEEGTIYRAANAFEKGVDWRSC